MAYMLYMNKGFSWLQHKFVRGHWTKHHWSWIQLHFKEAEKPTLLLPDWAAFPMQSALSNSFTKLKRVSQAPDGTIPLPGKAGICYAVRSVRGQTSPLPGPDTSSPPSKQTLHIACWKPAGDTLRKSDVTTQALPPKLHGKLPWLIASVTQQRKEQE